tara:strand:+ start:4910 stop:5626 length:717 start_codon:yes stop_codon:yes gene_type:complete
MSALNGTSNINELPNESTKNNVVMNIEPKQNNLMPQQMPQHLNQQMQIQQQQTPQMAPPQNQIQQQMPYQTGYNPQQQQQQQQQQMPVELSNSAVNTLVTGLSNTNSTNIPSRDIPQNQQDYTHDHQIQPNYIPDEDPRNYIEEEVNMEDMILQNKKKEEEQSNIDRIYDEFQYPILAMIIYFSLQLPYLNKILLKYLPSMFTKDHELKFTGYLFKTITFGLLFYGSIYFTRYLSELE